MDSWGIGAPWLMRGRWRAGLVLAWRLQGPQIELSGWFSRQETIRCTDGVWFACTMTHDIRVCIPVAAFMRFLQDQQDVLTWARLMVPKPRRRGRGRPPGKTRRLLTHLEGKMAELKRVNAKPTAQEFMDFLQEEQDIRRLSADEWLQDRQETYREFRDRITPV